MSQYYNPQRTRNLYDQNAADPFRLSRSKIDLFLECARCFYYDRKLGVGRPPGFPFSLNSAVDALLKKEFDIHRAKQTAHPLMKAYGVDAVPFASERMDEWRDSLRRGVQYHHAPTNLLITGGIDDIWVNPKKELIVVDYKATSKDEEITALDKDWHGGYKRQMEVYQWLLRRNDYMVSDTGYFVYCNGQTDRKAFDGKLEFDVTLIPYKGNDSWVETAVKDAHQCLNGEKSPEASDGCDYCSYISAIKSKEQPKLVKQSLLF